MPIKVQGWLKYIFISPEKQQPMKEVGSVKTEAGHGLVGDRYCTGNGSFNKGHQGHRQVTLISYESLQDSPFQPVISRRNLIVAGLEVNRLWNRMFRIGNVLFRGTDYCYPCDIPSVLGGCDASFKKWMHERGGIIAEVWGDGVISVNDKVVRLEEEEDPRRMTPRHPYRQQYFTFHGKCIA